MIKLLKRNEKLKQSALTPPHPPTPHPRDESFWMDSSFVLPLNLTPPLPSRSPEHRVWVWTMALLAVYVAFCCAALLKSSLGGSSSVLSLMQPYDFLYYSGVRAYYGEEWGKAAELLERSIGTRESLQRVRRQCHQDCEAAGSHAVHKLGKTQI